MRAYTMETNRCTPHQDERTELALLSSTISQIAMVGSVLAQDFDDIRTLGSREWAQKMADEVLHGVDYLHKLEPSLHRAADLLRKLSERPTRVESAEAQALSRIASVFGKGV